MVARDNGPQARRQYDLLLKGGEFIDPASGRRGRLDVAFGGDRVAAIGEDIDPGSAEQAHDIAGLMVVPGLIDMHAHAAPGIGIGADPDDVGIKRGATTVADAGTVGAGTFGVFKRVVGESQTRVFLWLHISTIGIIDSNVGEHLCLQWMDIERAVETARANPDLIVGFKARLSTYVAGGAPIPILRLLLEAGEAAGLPVMIHVGDTGVPLGQIMDMMRPGDVVSHYLTGRRHGILGIAPHSGAPIIPEAFEARRRGVILDTARGRAHMCFPAMQAAVEQGLLPDTLSTDLTQATIDHPEFSLPAIATQFMSFGVEFEDLLPCMTVNPAKALGRPDLGRLQMGGPADATVLRVEDGAFTITDVDGRTRQTNRRLVAAACVRNGKFYQV
jgi:dihydroorotase